MKKRILAVLLFSIFLSVSIFAADTPWYEGVKISSFELEGLQNVDKDKVDNILFTYRNKPYSEDVLNEIQSKLYGTGSFSYFYIEAKRANEDSNELVLSFNFFEKQLLKSITFNGNDKLSDADLLTASTLSLDSFYEGTEMNVAKQKIKEAYEKKGYVEAEVDPKLVENDSANTVSIDFTIKEGVQVIISEIDFEGNEKIDTGELRKQLKSSTQSFFHNGFYSTSNVATDIQNLQTLYNSKGYIEARIEQPTEEVLSQEENKKFVKLIYKVTEGDVWKFGKVNFSGNTVFSNDELLSKVDLKEGDVFNTTLWQNSLMKISDLYYNAGYINFGATPSNSIDEEAKTISLNLTFTEGEKIKINQFIFNGIEGTNKEVFERELTLKPGDYFSKEAMLKSLRNIQNTRIVTDLNFEIQKVDDTTCNVVINVVQGGQRDIQFGATFGGAATGFPISGLLVLTERNLFGTGNDLSVSANLSPTNQKASISFTDEWFNDIPWSNTFSFSYEHSTVQNVMTLGSGGFYNGREDATNKPYPNGYDSYEDYIAADKAKPDSRFLMDYFLTRLSVGYDTGYSFRFNSGTLGLSTGLSIGINKANYEENRDPYDYLIYQYGQGWVFSNKLNLGIAWDGRDLIENTTKGYYASQSFTYAGGFLLGLSNYIKSTTSFAAYTPLIKWTKDDGSEKAFIGSFSTSASFMLPQFRRDSTTGKWGWSSSAKEGATANEMLYIDGTTNALGHDFTTDLSFLFDNKFAVEYSIVDNLLAWDTFISATAATSELNDVGNINNWDWYFAAGSGLKVKIPGFPIGLYLVKDATIMNSAGDGFAFKEGGLFNFNNSTNSILNGVNLVLSLTTNLF